MARSRIFHCPSSRLVLATGLLSAFFLVAPSIFAQTIARPPCNWMDVGPERLQADQPGSVTPGPRLMPGPHTVWVALKQNNPQAPYSAWTPAGPFNVLAGKKYLVRVEDGTPPVISWQEESPRTTAYPKPGTMGVVYFQNATKSEKWYAIAVCSGNTPGATGLIRMDGFRFGITLSTGKLLTFAPNGVTNTTVVSIDGKTTEFGHPNGKVVEPFVPLPNGGVRSTWIMNNIRFTQLLEPTTTTSGVKDTVLIRWRIRNEGDRLTQVGLRLQLDTLIGQNDGVPFAVPGMADLVTKFADFPKQGPVPHFVQALEVPNLKNPGTVALLTLKVGGRTEAPSRLLLTHWPGGNLAWDLPIRDMGFDSAAVLYWPETPLQLSEEREIGFSYGLGEVKSTEGRIGASTVTQVRTGNEFPITSYVKDPARGETLTLQVPPGIELVGPATQQVPLPAADSKDRMSLVTWKARAGRAGTFEFVIQSSVGETQRQTLTVQQGEEVVIAGKGENVADLIRELSNPDPAIRLWASKVLGRLGASARPALPALQNATQDSDDDVRRVAANSAKAIQATPTPSEGLARWVRDLQSPDEIVRLRAAKELGKLGSAAVDAIPDLQRLLQDPDEDVRRVVASSIRAIQGSSGTVPNEAVQRLIQNLNSTDDLVRIRAAKDLAKMGNAARDAIPALRKLLQDPDEDIRRIAGNALQSIQAGGTEVTPPPPDAAVRIAGSVWSGTESLAGFGKLSFQFDADGKATMFDAKAKVFGKWSQAGNAVTISFTNCVYQGTLQGKSLTGMARYTTGEANWTFTLSYEGTAPAPQPQVNPVPPTNTRNTLPLENRKST